MNWPLAEAISGWIEAHNTAFAWLVAASVATFFGSLIGVPIVVARIPPDYFLPGNGSPLPKTPWRIFARILKNLVGAIFILAGMAMLFLPGQGILTMLIGIGMIDFPGKRSLELRIIQVRRVRESINWLRRKAGRQPLQIPPPKKRPRSQERAPTRRNG